MYILRIRGDVYWPDKMECFKEYPLKINQRRDILWDYQRQILATTSHPNRDDQRILICEYKEYVWVIPFIYEDKGIFLKTIYRSRKFKKLYEGGKI
ncbi:MAG: hypothetical protein PHY88_03105 [Candidatus Omnitrophica bacterium]|nr:hypothetical protein [Candidatus Omnitrophota bacterium]